MKTLHLSVARLAVAAALALSTGAAHAQWLAGYQFRKPLAINAGSGAGTGCQVLVRVGESSGASGCDLHLEGHAMNFPSDVRFTDNDGTTELGHWLEVTTGSAPNRTATFWVKVNDNLDSAQSVWTYYGKSAGATGSSGDAAFSFFDDFSGSAIDGGKWTIDNATGWSVSGGELRGTNTSGRIRSQTAFSSGVILETKYRTVSRPGNGNMALGFYTSASANFGWLNHPGGDFMRENGTWTGIGNECTVPVIARITAKATQVDFYVYRQDNGAVWHNYVNRTKTLTNEPIALGTRYDDALTGQAYDAYWDWIRVRKYATTTPAPGTSGTEQSANLGVWVTAPVNGQQFVLGSSVSATATFLSGTPPYTVKFYLDGNPTPVSTTTNATSPLTVNLGVLAVGSRTVSATVTDSTSTTVSSGTNTFTVFNAGNTGSGGTITYTDSSGLNPRSSPPYADGYVVHKFTSSGTLNIPVPASADVLVVGGGGGGGGNSAGGGGAGGYIYSNSFALVAGSNYQVTVGSGGVGGISSGAAPGSGSNSVFSTITATGGGRGASYGSGGVNLAAGSGGSGGGGFWGSGGAGAASPAGQGNSGGTGYTAGNNYGAGGGGGASAQGTNGTSAASGKGGDGTSSSISGTSVTYAGGGGGGGTLQGAPRGIGGAGGGGNGANAGSAAAAGTANTGGGGGGGYNSGNLNGAAGGSGIVIVRYPYTVPPFSIALTSPTSGQTFSSTASVSATATFFSGTPPYTVKFYLDSALVSTTTNASSPVTANLGVLAVGSHTVYATVTDSTSTTVSSGTAVPFTVVVDSTAPTPNPMTFAVAPVSVGPNSISMTATTATDALSPPVQYYFENTTNSTNSGWISSPTWTNTGLTTGVAYGYRVRARDSATPTANMTDWSAVSFAVPADPTITWDANLTGTGQPDGSGTWLNANQWWNASINSNTTWINSLPNNAVIGNGGAGGTITLGTVTAGTVTFNNFTGTYTLSGGTLSTSGGITAGTNAPTVLISSLVSGAGGIGKTGSGKLIITNTSNSYTGKTLVSGGAILQIGTGWGNSWASGTLPSGSNLELNGGSVSVFYYGGRSLGSGPGQIQITGGESGFSNLQYDAAGNIMTFNADANYEVVWGASGEGAATGFFNPSVLVMNVAGSGGNAWVKIPNKFDLNGTTRVIRTDLTGAGGLLVGVIRNSRNTAGLTKTGPGRLDLAGANTFNGPVTVSQGVLVAYSLANVTSPNSLGQSPAAAANLLLAAGSTLSYGGGAASTDRSVTLNGTAEGDSATLDASGSGAVSFTATTSPAYGVNNQARTLFLTGANTGDNTLAANLANNGTGKVSVTKTGRGTWVLSGSSSTHGGTTSVKEGTLKITHLNALGNSEFNIDAGAKANLAYSGIKTVAKLFLNGYEQINPGTYGSSTSGATYQDDYFFTGNGSVMLGTSTACNILTFNANFAGSSAVITTTNPTTGTVVVTVPIGTTPAQVAALKPAYTLSAGATCNQPNNATPSPALSLTTPVTYTVTALSGATKTYTVTVVPLAVTCTATFNLGTSPAATNFPLVGAASLRTWIAKGALSNGSILRSVKADGVKLEPPGNGSFAGSIGVFIDPTPDFPGGGDGLLKIGADNDYGGCTNPDNDINWLGGDNDGPFTDTRTDTAWSPPLDLSTACVMLGNGYTENTAYSGKITVKYDGAGNDILAFGAPADPAVNFGGATAVFTGGNTINLTVPYTVGQAPFKPVFFLSDGATCKVGATPVVSGVTLVDFTGGPVLFTVTSSTSGAVGAIKTYTVTVTVTPPSAACELLTFNPGIPGSSAVITSTGATGTVEVWVPYGTTPTQVAALAPTYTLSAGASCNQPNSAAPGPPLNFANPVTFAVTAENGTTTRTYNVSVIAPIFTENFNSYTSSGIGSGSGTQADTGLTYAYGGSLSGWEKSGADTLYAVDLNSAGNWALMFGENHVITQNTGIAANTTGTTYEVKFQIGTAVNLNAGLATAVNDGLRVEVLRADGSTLAFGILPPGAWSIPDNANLSAGLLRSLTYTGDGTGPVKLRIGADGGNGFGRFEASIDNVSVSELAISNYSTWANSNGIPGEPATGDFDHDGLTNLMEYALGLNPTTSSGSAGVQAGNVITFAKGAEAVANGDVSYWIETSTTLRNQITPGDGGWTLVTPTVNTSTTLSYTLPVGVSGGKIFARLKVTSP
jgi:autotransporter-associated beta strand protein